MHPSILTSKPIDTIHAKNISQNVCQDFLLFRVIRNSFYKNAIPDNRWKKNIEGYQNISREQLEYWLSRSTPVPSPRLKKTYPPLYLKILYLPQDPKNSTYTNYCKWIWKNTNDKKQTISKSTWWDWYEWSINYISKYVKKSARDAKKSHESLWNKTNKQN